MSICEHGIRSPWACDLCDQAALAQLHRAAPALHQALIKAREFVVLFLAFDGRDRGTPRMNATLDSLTKIACETDALAIAALADAQPASDPSHVD